MNNDIDDENETIVLLEQFSNKLQICIDNLDLKSDKTEEDLKSFNEIKEIYEKGNEILNKRKSDLQNKND